MWRQPHPAEVAMTPHGRHRKRHVVGPVSAAIATVAVLAGVWWVVNVPLDQDDPSRPARTPTASTQAAVVRATDDCRAARELFTEDVVAMHGAIQQWRIHIDAMTQLVAGRIDLAQAVAFWDSTRVEGKRSVAMWQRADGRYATERRSCAVPQGAGGTAAGLEACRQRQDAADAVLTVARRTLTDWEEHIGHMDALRAGKLDPGHALHLWDRMYERGKVALQDYDVAYRHLEQLPECPL